MLTSDLLRFSLEGPYIRPRYVSLDSPEHLACAQELIDIVAAHRGRRRGELARALKSYAGGRTSYKVQHGLAKLLLDMCEFKIESPADPKLIRRRLFAIAQENFPVVLEPDLVHPVGKEDVLAEVAKEFNSTPDRIGEAMYADLRENQVLVGFEPPTAEWLLNRYNVALAQGVLYRCVRMRLTVLRNLPARYKQLFKFIKFYGLMHQITGDLNSGYEVVLDGPASIFRLTQKYGLRMALFLPALLLCNRWRMMAEILGPDGRTYYFRLDDSSGLASHYTDATRYDSLLEQKFAERFERLDTEWSLERETEIVNLKDTVFIPDFAFRHADGRQGLLEIVGFWHPDYLKRKLHKLRRARLENLIVAVSESLRTSREDFSQVPGSVLFFKNMIDPRQVIEKLEEVARAPEPIPGRSDRC